MSRVDRLERRLKDTVKAAAVVGQTFSSRLLATMLGEPRARRDLPRGVAAVIWDHFTELEYVFHHALIRDAVYAMQLERTRRSLQRLAGRALAMLRETRTRAEEALELSDAIGCVDVFNLRTRLLVYRLRVGSGTWTAPRARAAMEELLLAEPDRARRAELHYELFLLDGAERDRAEGARLFRALLADRADDEYAGKASELEGARGAP